MTSTPGPPLLNPWKGLHFYTEGDQDIFFGRDQETEELLRLVQRDILTVLFARSGMGKTSLLRAAVIPRLRAEGILPVIVRVDHSPSALHPARQIVAAALAAAAASHFDVEMKGDPATDSLWEFFHGSQFWGPRNDLAKPVLILDQFEEVFTLGRHSQRSAEFLSPSWRIWSKTACRKA